MMGTRSMPWQDKVPGKATRNLPPGNPQDNNQQKLGNLLASGLLHLVHKDRGRPWLLSPDVLGPESTPYLGFQPAV